MESTDKLTHGVVLTRLHAGEWWHGHLVRSNLQYDCALLGRPTTMLFAVQRFSTGAVATSDRFLLTLDAEGIADPSHVQCTGNWGEHSGTDHEQAAARTIRETVMPLLYRGRDVSARGLVHR